MAERRSWILVALSVLLAFAVGIDSKLLPFLSRGCIELFQSSHCCIYFLIFMP